MEDRFKPMVRVELERALEELRRIPGDLRGPEVRLDLWRILERLEYAALILSMGFSLMDYNPSYGDLEGLSNRRDPSELAKLLAGCLEALEGDDPKRCYDGVKALVKLLGSLISGREG